MRHLSSTWMQQHARPWVLAAVCIMLAQPFQTRAATTESAVKAGFIYNFTKFIEWPASAAINPAFNLCVVGDNRLEDSLQALEGKMVAGKPLSLRDNVAGEALKSCHMVFVAQDDEQAIHAVLKELATLPIVTVSDSPGFVQKGGMIGLVRDGVRLAFEVNLVSTKAAGLHVSSQLLKLAKHVKKAGGASE